jgi:CRP/FNR family transcriptional regulator, cyclic AMP receptor protein
MTDGALGKHYCDGEVIVRQGELGDCMYVIQEGEVELIQRHGDKEFCLGMLKPGDFFGEMALLEKEVRPATVRAVGNTYVLSLEKRTFLHRMHEDASFAFRIIKKMAHRIRQLENALVRTADIGTLEAALFAAGSYAQQPHKTKVPEKVS